MAILRGGFWGRPAEGCGDEFVLEYKGEPRREEDERGNANNTHGRIEDKEDLGDKESNAPEEHGLGKAENQRQVLEAVDVVPALSEVSVLKRE